MDKKARILIIDDTPFDIKIVNEVLRPYYQVSVATNGEDALKVVTSEYPPDLILCDIMMPGIDGYGVLQNLRKHPQTATLPFIFLTSLTEKEFARKGMEMGADDFLTKPFTPEELLKAVSSRMEKHASYKRQESQKLNDLRSNISGAIPHELLTPLNSILGMSELLTSDYDSLNRQEIQGMHQDINNAGKRLLRVIQNFLIYAKLEMAASDPQKVINLRSKRCSFPSDVIADAAREQARKNDRESDLQLSVVEGNVYMEAESLFKLANEMIDNAFKFSRKGTPVKVCSEVNEDRYLISITDRGKGMTINQIMEVGAYMQFERKLHEQQGSGLGLIIAKRLAELHGGKLLIESIPGELTRITVELPGDNKPSESDFCI